MTDQSWQSPVGTSLALTTVSYTFAHYNPSMTSRRIVGATIQGGQQLGWRSPCGPNCTYTVSFIAPSIKCSRTPNIDDPEAPWTMSRASYDPKSSYWFDGYGSGGNYTWDPDVVLWEPVFSAGLNPNTSQFWAGVSHPFTPTTGPEPANIEQGLDVHVYMCDFMNSSYTVQVDYIDGHQTNRVLDIAHLNQVDIPANAWNYSPYTMSPDALDTASMYQILISTINGTIGRDPREGLVAQTTIALVPTLCTQYSGNTSYGQAEVALPYPSIGPLIEQLSHNISISLLSEPRLQVTDTTLTTCYVSRTTTVWKYDYVPLIAAYATAVGLTLICLVVGAHAVLASGCARDKTFSSIVRVTRGSDLDVLCLQPEDGALPLGSGLDRIRLKLASEADGRVAMRVIGSKVDS